MNDISACENEMLKMFRINAVISFITHAFSYYSINGTISGNDCASAVLSLPCIQDQCSKGSSISIWPFYQLCNVRGLPHFKT
jgi:hypothetical protein